MSDNLTPRDFEPGEVERVGPDPDAVMRMASRLDAMCGALESQNKALQEENERLHGALARAVERERALRTEAGRLRVSESPDLKERLARAANDIHRQRTPAQEGNEMSGRRR